LRVGGKFDLNGLIALRCRDAICPVVRKAVPLKAAVYEVYAFGEMDIIIAAV
jgi:hypothetical protein